jgi:sulfoxide reductase heme-binding subunit YedZ
MTALVLLIPLAVTSTAGMIKRMGGVAWRRLHRLVYLTGILAALHYLWLAKKVNPGPYYYITVLLLLFGIRLVDWGRRRLAARARVRAASGA